MKKILGISAYYHDSAAAIVVDGKVIAAAQEERFTREKHTPDFPENAIKYCLEESGYSLDELDAVVFYDKPFLKFERLLETYYAFAPKGLISFLKAIPVWTKEKLFLRKQLMDGLKSVEKFDKKKIKLLFSEHHLSHTASAFYPSNFEEAAILTIDGVGEWSTASISVGKGKSIETIKEMRFPHSVGLLYSAFTYFLGFTVNSGEYKVMGLAPYGNPNSEETKRFIEFIKSKLIDIKSDGSIWMDQSYFNYATGLRMIKENKWTELFGFGRRSPESEMEQKHCDLALAIQTVTEEIVLLMAKEARKLTGLPNLCLAGGVALNCVANGKLLRENIFENIYVQSAAGDAGGALGAALAIHHLYFEEGRIISDQWDGMSGSYLGPEYSNREVELMSRKTKAVFTKIDSFAEISSKTAQLIKEGNVIGWFQGRMEFGPRALGNRSILGNPSDTEMQQKINLKIKYREGFRPFAPSVLAEDTGKYFELNIDSPYMLMVAPVKSEFRKEIPSNYFELDLKTKLATPRSDFQAITHLDFSARIQSVHKETNPRYHQLLSDLKKINDHGMVLNTSFNVRGEPIVNTPFDAYRCFMSTNMDYLVINDFLFKKSDQPDFDNKEKWKVSFQLD